MKKFIFLMGALYVVFLISFKEPKEKTKSFSEMIKNDPSRIRELLDVADSLNQKDKIYATASIDPKDVIDNEDGELDVFRKKKKVVIDKNWPIIKLPTQDMLDIIGDPTEITPTDTLTFYLGTYKSSSDYPHGHDNSQKRIDRYNARKKGKQVWKFKDLDGHPTFIIESCAHCLNFFPAQTLFDAATMCPPPYDPSCGF